MSWKRLLLIALMAGGFAFVPVQRSDAQVSVGIGFGSPGYGYYPYGYYRPYPYYYRPSYYCMAGIGTTATTAIITTIGINAA